jgi:hypothetical protein
MSRIPVEDLKRPSAPSYPDVNIGPDSPFAEQGQPPAERQAQNPPEDITPHLKQVNQHLEQMSQATRQNEMLAQLGSDPQIQAILAARREGKKMKLVAEETSVDDLLPKGDDKEPDWAALAQNPKEFASHLTGAVTRQSTSTLLPLITKLLNEKLESLNPLIQKVDQLSGLVSGIHGKNLKTDFENVRGQNPELFDRMRPSMNTLFQQYPTMNIGDLFAFACAKAGVSATNSPNPASERATTDVTRQFRDPSNPHAAMGDIQRPASFSKDPQTNFSMTLSDLLSKKDYSGLPGVE